ncbi:hypothetical protein [Nocardia jejuensis]|uniref:hypothetical protein n=1 Tax=Nocardia jejuensis TaxID=328049 RepID=UPI000B2FD1AE|nr:hypothetical protein [Nocardia jejuensis]
MPNREEPGPESLPGPGQKRFDAVERLRKKLESMKPPEAAPAPGTDEPKVIRLPRAPRRALDEDAERPAKPWWPEGGSIYDPAPTRPVTRSELQRETGWWLADPRPELPASDDSGPEHGANVLDFGAQRRQRAGADTPARSGRRMARPRRVGPTPAEGSDTAREPKTDRDDTPDSPGPKGPTRKS